MKMIYVFSICVQWGFPETIWQVISQWLNVEADMWIQISSIKLDIIEIW